MKPFKLLVVLAFAAMVSVSTTPASAQNLFDNIKNSLEKLGNPPQQRKQQQQPSTASRGETPKFFKNLKKAFVDFGARQTSVGAPKQYARTVVPYQTRQKPGTIIIDPDKHFLYFVLPGGEAVRYGVGVGREGFGWRGTTYIGRKAEWPGWTPPPEMIIRERKKGIILPTHMKGGIKNPLGARALYLYNGGGDTAYRIHGSNEPWSIGQNVSSGCFRMTNKDVMDLYKRARVGAKVIVL